MAFLDVENLTIKFGGLTAVDHVNFKVNQGEIFSIIGPNGAGKTTVFNMLTGVYNVTEGSIEFKGKKIQNQTAQFIVKEGIARTFQNIRLFDNCRVIENVLIGMTIKTNYNFFDVICRTKKYRDVHSKMLNHAVDLLDEIGLANKTDVYADSLPYGDQRKLEIARAMATGAELILLDEPAAGMNPKETDDLMKFIGTLKYKGYTIILIDHDMKFIMNISDRILVLNHGKKIAEGLPTEVMTNSDVIAAYLGGAH